MRIFSGRESINKKIVDTVTITLTVDEAIELTEQLITHCGQQVTASKVIEHLTNELADMFPEEDE